MDRIEKAAQQLDKQAAFMAALGKDLSAEMLRRRAARLRQHSLSRRNMSRVRESIGA